MNTKRFRARDRIHAISIAKKLVKNLGLEWGEEGIKIVNVGDNARELNR